MAWLPPLRHNWKRICVCIYSFLKMYSIQSMRVHFSFFKSIWWKIPLFPWMGLGLLFSFASLLVLLFAAVSSLSCHKCNFDEMLVWEPLSSSAMVLYMFKSSRELSPRKCTVINNNLRCKKKIIITVTTKAPAIALARVSRRVMIFVLGLCGKVFWGGGGATGVASVRSC